MRLLLSIAALLFTPIVAQSQIVSAYATFSPTHLSGVRNGLTGDPSANFGYSTTAYFAPGIGGGVTINFLHAGPILVGFDFRGAYSPGPSGVGIGMFGARVTGKAPLFHLKPYLQASGGYLGTGTRLITNIQNLQAGSTSDDRFWVYEGFIGVDYPLLKFLDLRIFEFGAGQGLNVDGTHTSSGNYNVSIYSINTGVVAHF